MGVHGLLGELSEISRRLKESGLFENPIVHSRNFSTLRK